MGFENLLEAIVDDDTQRVAALLAADARLAQASVAQARLYDECIFHWLYAGDTALHLAAAGYRTSIVEQWLAAGADVNAQANHRRSTPLHDAADGFITHPAWDAVAHVATLRCLLWPPVPTFTRRTITAPPRCTGPCARAERRRSSSCWRWALTRACATGPARRRFIWRFRTRGAVVRVRRWRGRRKQRS